jgi:hypothetical protein
LSASGSRTGRLIVKPKPPEPLWPDGSPYVHPVQLTFLFNADKESTEWDEIMTPIMLGKPLGSVGTRGQWYANTHTWYVCEFDHMEALAKSGI